MKYRKASTVCSKKSCENPRAKGQRYCKKCRAGAEKERRARKQKEFLDLVADRAKLVALQIERLNGEQHTEAA